MTRLIAVLLCLALAGGTARSEILALINVEITGLDPDAHERIDIGAIY